MAYFNIKNSRTGEYMLGESVTDSRVANYYCEEHYISKYGSYFFVEPVDFKHPDWFPRELR